ncbi:MAG: MarR family transcriptional regulator [Dysgonamonadaceae bacterium]|jgi:DNA-binding MarR family transcriptional regulator|nr:MarR family transcriptional regulator [Dysgonamonadaceae bacterium]
MVQENLLFNISFAVKVMNIAFKQISKDFSVKVPAEELGILLTISLQDTVIQQDIAKYLQKTKSTVLRQIDKLEQKGLLTRTISENDRRSNVIQITEKGKKLLEEVNIKSNEFFHSLSNDLNDNDLDIFFQSADTFASKIQYAVNL